MSAHGPRPLRREPTQERSREMVERILAAGESVLVERGFDGASTNRIAERAGISPGSLYQYFPDKHAILERVLDRYVEWLQDRISHAFLGALAGGLGVADPAGAGRSTPAPGVSGGRVSGRGGMRDALAAILDVLAENPRMLRVSVEQQPRAAGSRRRSFAGRMDELVSTALAYQPGGSGGRPVRAVAWLTVRTVEHTLVSYVLERPPIERDVLLDELAELLTRYMTGERYPSG